MSDRAADDPIAVPAWLVRLCAWCWRGRRFLFGTVLLTFILNVIDTLTLVDPSTLHSLPIAWIFSYWPLWLTLFVLISLLTTLCGLIKRLAAPLSERELRTRYLEQVTRETELATLKGIPAGLILESVHLADIYIPPRFYPTRSRVDFPVSDEELERYRQALKQGRSAPDLERVISEAEQNWHHILSPNDLVGLDVVWQQLSKQPALVIQGYPGMGKSTLMERLTLHIAARGLRRPDPDMPERAKLTPTLVPVLVRLGSYARALDEKTELTLPEYLLIQMKKMELPDLLPLMQRYLEVGNCLVMLDGLDEVSKPAQREKVQEEIRNLVDGKFHCCRFIITSRVSGYDQAAFPAYAHFMLAELTDEEIDYFLPRWCRANLDRERALRAPRMGMHGEDDAREIRQRVWELKAAIEDNQGVRDLAKNPLLLTLLLVMQQNSIVLPRQRVELYDKVTKTLLESRNLAKGLEIVSEFQAIERLGPLACQMQQANSELVRQRDVEEALMAVIRRSGGTKEQVRTEAERFLKRIRERGGLFVSRVGDYFGFMHRTFQEYFAARAMLNNIKLDQQRWINELVALACHQDALWREPFLLAAAYPTYNNNEPIANRILRTLLAEAHQQGGPAEELAVVLAAEAIVEAKPLTIEAEVQSETITCLLACYEQAQRKRETATCQKIEGVIQRWLCGLPKEAYRQPLLDVITRTIRNTQRVASQRAVLTLLALIARRLTACPSVVFEALIPPLLALTGLPACGPYSPANDLAISTDFDVADLALCALSFLDQRGPAGLCLAMARDYFANQPEHLRLLARYSLECGTLITPTLVPVEPQRYEHYANAIERWIKLRDRSDRSVTERTIAECLDIQQILLAHTEKVSYLIIYHLLAMVRRSGEQTERPWSEIWQAYLLEQLNTGSYTSYQKVPLLWHVLFPREQLQPLANRIIKHYISSDSMRKRFAQRLLSYFTRYLRYLIYLRKLRYFSYLIDWSYLSDLRDLSNLRDLKYLVSSVDLVYLRDFSDLRYLRDLSNLIDFFITKDTGEIARIALPLVEKAEKIDLLTILQGRILQLQPSDQSGNEAEAEKALLVHAARQEIAAPDVDEEVREAALEVLRVLPARTTAEIDLIWKILDETQDELIHSACASALERAQPVDEAAWQEFERRRHSDVRVIRDAVEARVKRREEEANRK